MHGSILTLEAGTQGMRYAPIRQVLSIHTVDHAMCAETAIIWQEEAAEESTSIIGAQLRESQGTGGRWSRDFDEYTFPCSKTSTSRPRQKEQSPTLSLKI
jgi:hypothetical protein